MAYHFKNLVFEGGGVKGIAYVGAMEVLDKEGILNNIERVAGTSAGGFGRVKILRRRGEGCTVASRFQEFHGQVEVLSNQYRAAVEGVRLV